MRPLVPMRRPMMAMTPVDIDHDPAGTGLMGIVAVIATPVTRTITLGLRCGRHKRQNKNPETETQELRNPHR